MRKSLQIGEITFKYKKDAIAYFKEILNSYKIGETLNKHDYNDVYNQNAHMYAHCRLWKTHYTSYIVYLGSYTLRLWQFQFPILGIVSRNSLSR